MVLVFVCRSQQGMFVFDILLFFDTNERAFFFCESKQFAFFLVLVFAYHGIVLIICTRGDLSASSVE